MSTVAPVLAPVGAAHSAQGEVGLREPSLGLQDRALGEVLSPLLGQSESCLLYTSDAADDWLVV